MCLVLGYTDNISIRIVGGAADSSAVFRGLVYDDRINAPIYLIGDFCVVISIFINLAGRYVAVLVSHDVFQRPSLFVVGVEHFHFYGYAVRAVGGTGNFPAYPVPVLILCYLDGIQVTVGIVSLNSLGILHLDPPGLPRRVLYGGHGAVCIDMFDVEIRVGDINAVFIHQVF